MATVTALRKTKTAPVTIGSLIDGMNGLRELRREIAAQDADLKKQYDAAETQLIELLDQQNTSKGAGRTASASVSETTVFNPTNWDEFIAYVIKTKQGHLVQRRLSAPAVLEIFTLKGKVPGVEPFTKRSINLRQL